MNGFAKFRGLIADLQRIRLRAVQPSDSDKPAWFDVLKRVNDPPLEAQPAKPVQEAESERTPLQKAILEFVTEKRLNSRKTGRIRRQMIGSEVWKSIAANHGVSTNPPDWHTINRTLGRE